MFSSVVILCLCALFGQLNASAIPMWEFLSRQEKMSYLYSIFANQVESFCETSTLTDCNRELLKFGLKRLKAVPEEALDAMDPYQRGASTIIWEALMQGHALAKTTPKPRSTTTAKPNSYEDESLGDLDFGSQTAASAKIDNVYRVPPPKGFVFKLETGRPQYTYPLNRGSYYNSFGPSERKGAYTKFQQLYITTSTTTQRAPVAPYQEVPLTGPMVVRVYPDGRPVRDNSPLPQDEDLRQYMLSKVQIPNIY